MLKFLLGIVLPLVPLAAAHAEPVATPPAATALPASPAATLAPLSANPFERKAASSQAAEAVAGPTAVSPQGLNVAQPSFPPVTKQQPSGSSRRVAPRRVAAEAEPEPELWEEQVQGTPIGKVGGEHIFRVNGTYVFKSTKELKIVKTPVRQSSSAAFPAAPFAGGSGMTPVPSLSAVQNTGLPSMVGRPAPAAGGLPQYNGSTRPGMSPASTFPNSRPSTTR